MSEKSDYSAAPEYEDSERGLFGGRPNRPAQPGFRPPPQQHQQGPNPHQQGPNPQQQQGPYSPPPQQQYSGQYNQQYNQPFNQQQQQYPNYNVQGGGNSNNAEPIRLPLINPMRPQSGFSQAMPERLHALTRRPIEQAKWSVFIEELNTQLKKTPGSLANGVSQYWITKVATLGVSRLANNMYASHVLNDAMELVDKYNRAEFAEYGVVVHLSPAKHAEDGSHHAKKHEKEEERAQRASSLELVIERA